MFCTKCGKKLSDDTKFCTGCGTPVKDPTAATSTPPGASTASMGQATPPAENAPLSAPQAAGGANGGQTTPAENAPFSAPQAAGGANGGQTTPAENAPFSSPQAADSAGDRQAPPPNPEAFAATDLPDVIIPNSGYTMADGEAVVVKKSLVPMIAVLALAVLLVGIGSFFLFRTISINGKYTAQMSEAQTLLTSGAGARAAALYEDVLMLKPESTDAALGLAKAYLTDAMFPQAAEALSKFSPAEGDSIYAEYQQLVSIAQFAPAFTAVDTSNFPRISVNFSCGGSYVPAVGDLTVTENGNTLTAEDAQNANGVFTFTYQADDVAGYDSEQRAVSVTLKAGGFTYRYQADYSTPHFESATLKLVSTDVSQYPRVKAYFRVESASTGDTVTGLNSKAFLIYERLQGGDFLAREVHSVSPLEGNLGLNIDLVADKSSSISNSDMEKIKQVMIEFVNSLHFSVGDKAEILAFDDIVQQMCYYTSDNTLLVNGIRNMSTDGLTALYDAIYLGINHAALQGGARCVIAFTDGMDNRSSHTVNEIISYANTQQVPVYIIGVGSGVETGTLQNIAHSTGGQYWFIDDLYDLQAIFNAVYAEQKELYVVEYESDSTVDQYMARDLSVSMTGGGFKAEGEMSFRPVRTINDNGGVQNTSRYELIKESLSWEAAAQRCQEMGGHLATITSQSEMDELTKMAEAADVKYVWLGGYTSYDQGGNVFGHWITGEDFSFQAWARDEPSRKDQDGEPEWYIMLWNIPSLGGWNWNDQRNDPAGVLPGMKDGMGFICEFES